MENNANPWNMNNGERADWAADIDVQVVDPSIHLITSTCIGLAVPDHLMTKTKSV